MSLKIEPINLGLFNETYNQANNLSETERLKDKLQKMQAIQQVWQTKVLDLKTASNSLEFGVLQECATARLELHKYNNEIERINAKLSPSHRVIFLITVITLIGLGALAKIMKII